MSKIFTWMSTLLLGGLMGWTAHYAWDIYKVPRQARIEALEVTEKPLAGIDLSLREQEVRAQDAQSKMIVRLLNAQKYTDAVETCESYQAVAIGLAENYCRSIFLSYAQQLRQKKLYVQGAQLLQTYLAVDFRAIKIRELLSTLYQLDGRYMDAIHILYEARGYAHQSITLNRLLTHVHELVEEYAQWLRDRDDAAGVKILYEAVTQWEPEHAAYFYHLAKAQLDLNEYARAQESLSLIAYDPHFSDRAQQLLKTIEQQVAAVTRQETRVPLDKAGDHFVVDAWINSELKLRMLIDTGASMTIIKPSVLQASGVQYIDTQRASWFQTAGGKIKAPIWRVAEFSLQDKEVTQFEVVAIELDNFPYADGLLGMNYLKNFTFFIDQSNHFLRLHRVR